MGLFTSQISIRNALNDPSDYYYNNTNKYKLRYVRAHCDICPLFCVSTLYM